VKKRTLVDQETIELRVIVISQLFDTLDPFPSPECDLDSYAEEFIVGWAREPPRDAQDRNPLLRYRDREAQQPRLRCNNGSLFRLPGRYHQP